MTITIIKYGLWAAMGATVIALALGLIGMLKDAPFHRQYGNRLMQLRVLFQGIAIALFALLMVVKP